VQYEWNHRKAASNLRRYGVDFRHAAAALEDPNRLKDIDARFAYGEARLQVIEMAEGASCSRS